MSKLKEEEVNSNLPAVGLTNYANILMLDFITGHLVKTSIFYKC